jgi:hypothetical protein
MKIRWTLWGGFAFSFLSHLGMAASASPIELKLLPANGSVGKNCTQTLFSSG